MAAIDARTEREGQAAYGPRSSAIRIVRAGVGSMLACVPQIIAMTVRMVMIVSVLVMAMARAGGSFTAVACRDRTGGRGGVDQPLQVDVEALSAGVLVANERCSRDRERAGEQQGDCDAERPPGWSPGGPRSRARRNASPHAILPTTRRDRARPMRYHVSGGDIQSRNAVVQ
ncbi:MAG: hypothetical protein AB7V27_12320 [Candidatus Binatia bacterium]